MRRKTIKQTFSVPGHIRYLAGVYLWGMAIFTMFRLLLFLTNLDQFSLLPDNRLSLVARSFLMGFRFDTVISGYILVIPFLVLSIGSLLRQRINGLLVKIIPLTIGILYSLAFLVCSVDIPYFNHFFSRISGAIFTMTGSPGFVLTLIFQEVKFWIYLVPFGLVCLLFWWLLIRLGKNFQMRLFRAQDLKPSTYYLNLAFFSVLCMILFFAGIRGRMAVKSPIRVGTAFFSSYGFPNQLGLNPVFTLARSILDDMGNKARHPAFMDDRRALDQVRGYFNVKKSDSADSPVVRRIEVSGKSLRANVILVIMESMSADLMGYFGNAGRLTPNLDRLIRKSYLFENIYTAGIHTYSGIYSSLFAYPVYLRRHPLKGVSIPEYSGLPNTLKMHGYQTVYFTTHDDQFDNIGGFLRANGMDRIVSEDDYPSDRVLSTLGVPDDFMFEFSIPLLNQLHQEGRPFFATFLTASNHQPFIIPRGVPFKPRSFKLEHRIVEYADWALGKFLRLAAAQEWYRNTLFVFIADSGSHVKNSYDLPLSFFHTPLIIHAPHLLKEPRCFNQIGGQIDLFPTVMGLLNLEYVNNTFGIDLLRERRPFIYFCGDDKVGCLSHDYYLVIRAGKSESLYHYASLDPRDHIAQQRPLAERMKVYCFSMLQASQWMVENRKVGPVR